MKDCVTEKTKWKIMSVMNQKMAVLDLEIQEMKRPEKKLMYDSLDIARSVKEKADIKLAMKELDGIQECN